MLEAGWARCAGMRLLNVGILRVLLVPRLLCFALIPSPQDWLVRIGDEKGIMNSHALSHSTS